MVGNYGPYPEEAELKSISSASIAKERAAIDSATSDNNELVAALHSLISKLEEKLMPVSAQVPPSGETQSLTDGRGSSPLYFRIEESNSNLRAACDRLNSLRRNLEV